ncbi:MAG: cupin domain-containing protein [Candidatus Zixiibacteriota bacterium]|nr:MAG: cupin domain-containing protein [candidate division Zixibacteria bacterium]
MKITNFRAVEAREVDEPGAKGVKVRWLISEKDGAPNFAMRLFEMEPGGHTPYHKHEWEHEVFVLKGKGDLVTEGNISPLNEGDALLVPADENHQFKNTSEEAFIFLCMIPHRK